MCGKFCNPTKDNDNWDTWTVFTKAKNKLMRMLNFAFLKNGISMTRIKLYVLWLLQSTFKYDSRELDIISEYCIKIYKNNCLLWLEAVGFSSCKLLIKANFKSLSSSVSSSSIFITSGVWLRLPSVFSVTGHDSKISSALHGGSSPKTIKIEWPRE